RAMFGSEVVAFILLAALAWRRKNFSIARPKLLAPAMLVVLFSGSLGIAMAGMMIRIDRIPHGDWDGWAIWNAHARFLFRDGQNWQRDISYTFHPDYPLLVPSTTARTWRYLGREVPEAGAVAGMIFGLSTIAVLTVTLLETRDLSVAMMMGLMLIST